MIEKQSIDERLEQSVRAAANEGSIRFLDSPNAPWRNGYRNLTPSEFETMKASLVGQPNARTSPNQCPGCVIDATLTAATKA